MLLPKTQESLVFSF